MQTDKEMKAAKELFRALSLAAVYAACFLGVGGSSLDLSHGLRSLVDMLTHRMNHL